MLSRMANSNKRDTKRTHDYRLSFFAAASFQWVNPKGWTMAITATTVYNQNGSVSQLVTIATTFLLFNLPSGTAWVIAGGAIKRWLKSPQRVKGLIYRWLYYWLLQ